MAKLISFFSSSFCLSSPIPASNFRHSSELIGDVTNWRNIKGISGDQRLCTPVEQR
jgi:hypothetical protein